VRILKPIRCIFILGTLCFAWSVRAEDYVETNLAYDPIAYWRLDENAGTSLVGGYSSTYVNGATTTAPGN
jgi:hypothetical protein